MLQRHKFFVGFSSSNHFKERICMKRMALVFVLVVFLVSGCASTKLIVERTDNKPITLEQIADDRNVCHNVVRKKIMDNDIRLNTKNVYVVMSCGGTDMVPCDHL